MVFLPPSYVPEVPQIPDSTTVGDFIFANWKDGRHEAAKNPFTCGLSSKTYTAEQVASRVESLARSLSAELGWTTIADSGRRVVGIFSVNSIDTMTVSWAVHRLSGVCSLVNAAYSESECVKQLVQSKCQALFTCVSLASLAMCCAAKAGIPEDKVYILETPDKIEGTAPESTTVNQLIDKGATLPRLARLDWLKGQGARQAAFLCASSGTSGLPKLVEISHKNIIANIIQLSLYENTYRSVDGYENCLGLLPQSHSFALIMMCHYAVQRGDGLIVLPRFDMRQMLETIQRHQINRLYLVPPLIVAMVRVPKLLAMYNLDSVSTVVVGAAKLSKNLATKLFELQPRWTVMQGYGLTETSVVVSVTSPLDVSFGSCGSLLPGYEARIVDADGNDLGHDEPGELLLRSPSIMLGYLDNREETDKNFTHDNWLRTGDMVEIRLSNNGHDHIYIVDRIKELIKVKGMQVAPAELEAILILHPAVEDAAVVPVPHTHAGEVPKAVVVRSKTHADVDETQLKDEIADFVKDSVAHYKQLAGGIDFVEQLPRSPAGKLLRRVIRQSMNGSEAGAGQVSQR